ncbi:LacI family DNA-binding transcriptional regulator [Microlunatus sp. GCM10028923]|uniref:LacI family DNA-binding transcriptional regulator n=1 Tax=Microlunatus sp. GCM10028923 TaxID=3273400 RepID=UPI003619079B
MAERTKLGLDEVARHAGVSTATVSNVLNRPEIVTAKTKAKVLASIEELGFVPNRAAATLRQGLSRLVGLVIPDIANPFYAEIARGVADAADTSGFTVAVCVTGDDPEREARQLRMLAEQRAAGALIVPITADQSRLRRLRAVGSRLVLVDRLASTTEGCAVAIDDVQGGRIAVDHLLSTGRSSIAMINGPATVTQCTNRRTGARLAFEKHHRDPDSMIEYEVVDMSFDEGRELGRRLAEGPLPDAVFCINDLLGAGLALGLHDRGVRVPDDLAIVGYGDLEPATHGIIGLTTVEQPKYELGRAAMRMLLEETAPGPVAHRHSTVLYTPSLIIRESAPALGTREAVSP